MTGSHLVIQIRRSKARQSPDWMKRNAPFRHHGK